MDKLDFDLVKIGKEIDEKLLSFLKKNKITQKRLIDAFIYSTIGSGKRIRAYLLVEAFRLFDNLKFYISLNYKIHISSLSKSFIFSTFILASFNLFWQIFLSFEPLS